MSCIVPKYTTEQLRDSLLERKVVDMHEMTVPQRAVALRQMNSLVSTQEISAKDLKAGVRKRLGLELTDTIPRYVLDGVMLAGGRISDIMAAKFIKKLGLEKAQKLHTDPDNILKSTTGTKFHWGAERLLEHFIEADKSGKVVKLSELDGKPANLVSDKEIMQHIGLTNPKHFKAFKEGVKEAFNMIVETQRKIDPSEKVHILPEQFILNPETDTGGTIDLLALYSDGTHSNMDWKNMMIHSDAVEFENYNVRPNEEFIPEYKIEAYQDQLSQSNSTMKSIYGSKGTRLSRILPIHVRFKYKPRAQQTEGHLLKDQIEHVSTRATDMGLEHVPVGEMVTLANDPGGKKAAKINDQIGKLSIVINNRRKERSNIPYALPDSTVNPKWAALTAKIKSSQKAMNRLILHQDFSSLYKDFDSLIKRIHDSGIFNPKTNFQDREINGKPNLNYLDQQEIRDMKHEVAAYQAMMESSGDYLVELKISDPKLYNDYLQSVQKLSWESGQYINRLDSILTDRELTTGEQDALGNTKKPNFWERYFRTLREQVGIPFRKTSEHIDRATSMKRVEMQHLQQTLIEWDKRLEAFGRSIGKSIQEVYDMLINEGTENLHGQYSSEFYDSLADSQVNKDLKWLKNNLQLKENYKDILEHNLKIHKFNNPQDSAADIAKWKAVNNPESLILSNKRWWTLYDPVGKPENFSEGYNHISQHAELLEFYKFWTETMADLNNKLGLSKEERLPKNLLPHIRASVVELAVQGDLGWGNVTESIKSLWQVREDDFDLGDFTSTEKRDPTTGRPIHTVPRHFINPLKDNAGRIRKGLKLRDLTKSLYIYADMAHTHNLLKNEVEPHVLALRDVMIAKGMQDTASKGNKKLLTSGVFAKITGEGTDIVDLFDKLVNYHLYGIKIQDTSREWAKAVAFLKGTQSKIELAFSPLLWIGNLAQITANSYFEGHNGYFYDKTTMFETQKDGGGVNGKAAKDKYDAISYLFEFSPGITNVRQKDMSSSGIARTLDWDTAFIGMRKSEQAVNNNIGISVLKTHTLIDGNLKRLATAPEGSKSVYDMLVLDSKGNLTMEGFIGSDGKVSNIDTYTNIRRTGLAVAKLVKGQLDPGDLSGIHMSLLGDASMGFKTWMPGMIDARFTGLRYNQALNTIVEGKYSALATDMVKEDRAIGEWLTNVVAPSLGRFGLHLITFGAKEYKVNETRARHMFNAYKQEHLGDETIQNMSLQDFIEYKQGQIRSLAAEVTTILAMVGMVMALRTDWDNDGEPLWKKDYLHRTVFRAVNRARRETAFFVSPGDWTSVFRMPIPIMSLPINAFAAIQGARKGIWEYATGQEPDPRQRRSHFYPTLKVIPGNKVFLMLEGDELSKLREL